jgi:CDP-paratose 2-epimerase
MILAYLMKCTATGTPYRVFGYRGKQVRDNIHSADLIAAFDCFFRAPRQEKCTISAAAASALFDAEAIAICEEITAGNSNTKSSMTTALATISGIQRCGNFNPTTPSGN